MTPILAFGGAMGVNHPWLGFFLYFGITVVVVLLVAWWLNKGDNE
jgi:hypothetical protein